VRYELSDSEWATIKPLLPNKSRGVRRVNDRRVLNGIFGVLRSGAPWRDLPVCYGPRTTCYNRFVRWRRAEIWGRKQLIAEMEEEERRAAREGLTEEELAIFDLLTKPEPRLTKTQEIEVKKVARELLIKLHDLLDVFDWRARQQPRAAVQSTIRFTLNELPEEPYPEKMWEAKVEAVWAHIFSRTKVNMNGAPRRHTE